MRLARVGFGVDGVMDVVQIPCVAVTAERGFVEMRFVHADILDFQAQKRMRAALNQRLLPAVFAFQRQEAFLHARRVHRGRRFRREAGGRDLIRVPAVVADGG